MRKPTIMIVDDEPINLSVLCRLLTPKNDVRAFKSGAEALLALEDSPRPDLILLDVMMPGLNGFSILGRIQEKRETREIPVIFITSLDNPADEDKGFGLGAVDYIIKPFKPSAVLARVNVHLELKDARDKLQDQNRWLESEVEKRIQEIQLIQNAAMTALMRLAETRDENTGNHIRRTCRYVEILALEMRSYPKYVQELSENRIRSIVRAAQLHDIGKIGVSDQILRKPGKLDKEEFEIIKTHCAIGANALRAAKNEALKQISEDHKEYIPSALQFLDEAEVIARNHHEKWDGAGYPDGKKGADIPLAARIMALADVFDALTTARPYKKAWTMEETSAYIGDQSGKAFDPDVVAAFVNNLSAFDRVRRDFADDSVREG